MVEGSLLWKIRVMHLKPEDQGVDQSRDQDQEQDLDQEDELEAGLALLEEENLSPNQDPGPSQGQDPNQDPGPSLGRDLVLGPSLSPIMNGLEAEAEAPLHSETVMDQISNLMTRILEMI